MQESYGGGGEMDKGLSGWRELVVLQESYGG